jgi:hypothetical protein
VAASVSTVPAAPIAGRDCKLVLSASSGNYVRVWCVDAPPGSKWRSQLDSAGATQVSVAAGDAGQVLPFQADKGGAYLFKVEECTRGASAYGGVYDTDPNKAPSLTILSTTSVTLYFASPLTCNLGVGADTAELLIYVLAGGVIETTQELHGVVSPVLRSSKTGLAKVAAESAVVRAAVAALPELAGVLLGNVAAWLNSLHTAINAHLQDGDVHANADGNNVVSDAFRNATTTEGQKRAVAAMRKALDNHMRNDDPSASPPGTGTGNYHDGAGGSVDWANALLSAAPGDQLSVLVSAADTYRAYEAHRLSDVHAEPDSTNVVSAPPPLLALHVAFIRQLATHTPDTPTNEHSAKALLLSAGGFKEI